MAEITLKGNPIHTSGDLPEVGAVAPDFKLTDKGLADHGLEDYRGQRVILNIFPSVDTAVCSASVRRFNVAAAALANTAVLNISRDLPFAFARFCGAEGIDRVETLSELRDMSFGDAWGVRIIDGPMAGLLARAVVVLDEHHKIVYTELVPEIAQEPNYEAALKFLST